MEFEFDPAKSEANLREHKIDFEEAQELWKDENAAVADARSDPEPRQALIGCFRERSESPFSPRSHRRSA